MSTAVWREEKSESVVKAICRVLASDETPKSVRDELGGEALWNALKLFSNALEERLGSTETKWSPALVGLFRDRPDQCEQWLVLMTEPEFSVAAYWRDEK